MKDPGADFIDPVSLDSLRGNLRGIVDDPETRASFTVTTTTSRTFNHRTGAEGPSDVVDDVTGSRSTLKAEEVKSSPDYRSEDVRYIVSTADLTTPPIAMVSVVTEDSTRRKVYKVETDVIDALVYLYARVSK